MKKVIVENLLKKKKRFEVAVDISFSVHSGEIFALVGIQGSGKTLITKILGNVVLRHSGTMFIDRASSGMFIKDQNFYIDKTPYSTLRYFAKLNKDRVSHERIMNTLNLTGLKRVKDNSVSKLDKNQISRLKLAVAMVANPDVLILDEPFDDLEHAEARLVRVILKTLADKFNVAILVTAKDLEGIEEICDTVGIIDNGTIVCVKSYNELIKANDAYTKICVSTPTPNLTAKTIEDAFGYVTNLCGSDVIVNTHPIDAQAIYDELKRKKITVFGMSKVNKSIKELFYTLLQRKRGARGDFHPPVQTSESQQGGSNA